LLALRQIRLRAPLTLLEVPLRELQRALVVALQGLDGQVRELLGDMLATFLVFLRDAGAHIDLTL